MDRQAHWDAIYAATPGDRVSWFEQQPSPSLQMIDAAGLTADTCVVDVGGGASHLVDALIARGLTCLAVLDVSAAAIERARSRLGNAGRTVTWLATDVTAPWTLAPVDIWHDRAVFHFLTDPDDRLRYRERLRDTLKAGGSAIIATFAPDGPERCSGLPVVRYSPHTLAAKLGEGFELVDARPHLHTTPAGAVQSFQYSRFIKRR